MSRTIRMVIGSHYHYPPLAYTRNGHESHICVTKSFLYLCPEDQTDAPFCSRKSRSTTEKAVRARAGKHQRPDYDAGTRDLQHRDSQHQQRNSGSDEECKQRNEADTWWLDYRQGGPDNVRETWRLLQPRTRTSYYVLQPIPLGGGQNVV